MRGIPNRSVYKNCTDHTITSACMGCRIADVNADILPWLPVISPVATLVIVVIGVLFSHHHVDARLGDFSRHMDSRFADMSKLITAESARLEAVLRLELAGLSNRIKALEDRSSVLYGR